MYCFYTKDIDTFFFAVRPHTTVALFEEQNYQMFNNIENIFICSYYSETKCEKTPIYKSYLGIKIKHKMVDISKDSDNTNFKFSVKDSRINIYIQWRSSKNMEKIITRLRVVNGKNL